MMKKILLRTFISSILSGFCIVIGATVFLLCKGHGDYGMTILGSILFGIGLFTIIHFNLWLYTGKVGGLLDKEPKYILRLLTCLIGNLVGVISLSALISLTNNDNAHMLHDVAVTIVDGKMSQSWYSCLILSVLCGMMIYIAVKGHAKCPYSLGKVLFAFLPISAFILCGFEHVIANGAYFTYAGYFSWKALGYFALMALGNGIGAIALDGLLKIIIKLDDRKKKVTPQNDLPSTVEENIETKEN